MGPYSARLASPLDSVDNAPALKAPITDGFDFLYAGDVNDCNIPVIYMGCFYISTFNSKGDTKGSFLFQKSLIVRQRKQMHAV